MSLYYSTYNSRIKLLFICLSSKFLKAQIVKHNETYKILLSGLRIVQIYRRNFAKLFKSIRKPSTHSLIVCLPDSFRKAGRRKGGGQTEGKGRRGNDRREGVKRKLKK